MIIFLLSISIIPITGTKASEISDYTISIKGIVTDSVTGQPIQGADVVVWITSNQRSELNNFTETESMVVFV